MSHHQKSVNMIKNTLLSILFIAALGINTSLAQLQLQKLEFDLDKDGVTDTVWFDIEKGQLEILLSTQDDRRISTTFLFDPLKIYSYQLIQEGQGFRLYIMNLPLFTDAHFYYDEKENRIRLSQIIIENRNNPPGHGYKVVTDINLLTGKFTEKSSVYHASTDEFIDEIRTGKGKFGPVYVEEYKTNTAKELLGSLIIDD